MPLPNPDVKGTIWCKAEGKGRKKLYYKEGDKWIPQNGHGQRLPFRKHEDDNYNMPELYCYYMLTTDGLSLMIEYQTHIMDNM
jgi:hypothetical protein